MQRRKVRGLVQARVSLIGPVIGCLQIFSVLGVEGLRWSLALCGVEYVSLGVRIYVSLCILSYTLDS